MSITDKVGIKDIVISVVVVVVFAVAMLLTLNSYSNEGEKRSAVISQEGEKNPNHIEAFVKLLTIDPVKGDITTRIEFIPHGSFAKEDGTLAHNVKLDINSATGKQEHSFEKGKRMNPTEAVVSLYDGLVTDYPFDRHSAFLEFYFTTKPEKTADNPKPTGSTDTSTDKPADVNPSSETKPTEQTQPTEEEVPLAVDFFGSIAGYKIEAAKTKESDDSYVGIDMKISRSSTVAFFSVFVMILMWATTLAVMFMVLSIVLRGRKIELAMFSFIAALLFAFAAVRNSQPGVPPIGTYSDYISFFWAEVILSLSLLTIIFTWLFRPGMK
jgi:hypothetical protein